MTNNTNDNRNKHNTANVNREHSPANEDYNQFPKDSYEPERDSFETSGRTRYRKKPWYNQGWVWLIVAFIAILVLYLGFSGLSEETAKINQSIQDQTSVIKEQSSILESINTGINNLSAAIKEGVHTIVVAIKDAVISIINVIQGMV